MAAGRRCLFRDGSSSMMVSTIDVYFVTQKGGESNNKVNLGLVTNEYLSKLVARVVNLKCSESRLKPYAHAQSKEWKFLSL